jgi:tetratricopeptide (TPR) repeat protein
MYSRALAFQELGYTGKAEEIFKTLLADAEKIINTAPNPVAYTDGVENRWDKRIQLAKAYYMMALGNHGLGNNTLAVEFLSRAFTAEPSYLSAKAYRFLP